MPTFIESKPANDSRRDGESPSDNLKPTFIGSRPATDSRRDGRNPFGSSKPQSNAENRLEKKTFC